MAYIINVNPVDLEKNIALGVDLPYSDKVGSVFKQNYFTKDQALANARNLLLTEPGERVMLPNFGCGLRRTLFEQLSKESLEALERRIRGSFQNFLPLLIQYLFMFLNHILNPHFSSLRDLL